MTMPTSTSTVWVGGLPDHMDDVTFAALFADHGTVVSTKLCADKWFGFVNFASEQEAQNVITTLDGAELLGRILKIKPHTVVDRATQKGANKGGGKSFAGADQSGSQIQRAVAAFGQSKGAGYGPSKGKGKGGGFSPYGSQSAYSQQLSTLMGGGAAQYAQPIPESCGACCASHEAILVGKAADWTKGEGDSSLYIQGLPEWADMMVLYQIFSPYGAVLTTFVKDTVNGKIGFVTYASDVEAQYAISRLNGQLLVSGEQLCVKVQSRKKTTPAAGSGISPPDAVPDAFKDELVAKVKAFQRTGVGAKDTWHAFCQEQFGKNRDPARYESDVLQTFISMIGI